MSREVEYLTSSVHVNKAKVRRRDVSMDHASSMNYRKNIDNLCRVVPCGALINQSSSYQAMARRRPLPCNVPDLIGVPRG